mgnify:CR=1 FL=1
MGQVDIGDAGGQAGLVVVFSIANKTGFVGLAAKALQGQEQEIGRWFGLAVFAGQLEGEIQAEALEGVVHGLTVVIGHQPKINALAL